MLNSGSERGKESHRWNCGWFCLIVALNALAGMTWVWFANWIMGFSHSHDWLSSFVEVAFALNVALSVQRIVDESVRPMRTQFRQKVEAQISCHEQKLAKDVFAKFRDCADEAIARFEEIDLPRLEWCVRISRVAAVLSIIALLAYDGQSRWTFLIPSLVLPPIWFFVTCKLMALKELLKFANDINAFLESLARRIVEAHHKNVGGHADEEIP